MAPLTPLQGEPPLTSLTPMITGDPSDPYNFFLPVADLHHEEDVSSLGSSTLVSDYHAPLEIGTSTVETHPTSSQVSLQTIGQVALERIPSAASIHSNPPSTPKQPTLPSTLETSRLAGSNVIGGEAHVTELFPHRDFKMFEDKALYMQLYRAAGNVYAVKEAMWDELVKLILKGDPTLKMYGWEDNDYRSEPASRRRFEVLFQRYKE